MSSPFKEIVTHRVIEAYTKSDGLLKEAVAHEKAAADLKIDANSHKKLGDALTIFLGEFSDTLEQGIVPSLLGDVVTGIDAGSNTVRSAGS